jgi:16S rRNA (guanine(966)-N(2))-methyltransferase RsmD
MDRVKASLFDILRPQIDGISVLDLFAGSGSVGIEALSQGAGFCTFTELASSAIKTIKRNLATTGLADRARVVQTDAFAFLKTTTAKFDLIYVAPPQYKNLWSESLLLVDQRTELFRSSPAESGECRPVGLVIVQIHPKEYLKLDLGTLHETRQKRYGNTLLVFFDCT